MNIYVDFDDCLCETARYFSRLAADMFGKRVPYEQMHSFDLKTSFDLTDEQYEQLIARGHETEVLLGYEETPGASGTIRQWIRGGHDVSVITGRPYRSYDASREWLNRHGLCEASLYCMDKYGRESSPARSEFCLAPDDYFRMRFDYAIEDSPLAFRFFDHLPALKVIVFDRPWNRNAPIPNGNYDRCFSWSELRSWF